MKLLSSIQDKKSNAGIGGKAKNLLVLEDIGANVPAWAVIPQAVLLNQLPYPMTKETREAGFQKLKVPSEIINGLKQHFGEHYATKTYAVRSSALDEDGVQFSFAGQFASFLHVAFTELEEKIKVVWQSVAAERVLAYRKKNNLPSQWGIGVIVQEMVEAEVAGVAFGQHPVSGDPQTKVVSAVYGLGEGLVSGELNADTFTLSPKGIEVELTPKPHAFVRKQAHHGIEKIDVDLAKQTLPTLQEPQLQEIAQLLDRLKKVLGTPQDIEFAYVSQVLYLLQTRPVTSTNNSTQGEYILWDNSNIVESYPGITTPLTFSFIIKMYEKVYRQFVGIMGVKEKEINQHTEVFANTLGLVRGRVYYNLLHWYKMLAMLPGYSINAENMERMMGVKERFELNDEFKMSKGLARWRIVGMVFRMLWMQMSLPKERKRFLKHLNQVMARYKAINFQVLSIAEIIRHYNTFENTLLLKWKAPLINDFFAMIWFGMLQKKSIKYFSGMYNVHNDLLCGSQDIISVEPIHDSIAIAQLVVQNSTAKELFSQQTPQEIWQQLEQGTLPEIKQKIEAYIDRFGERCVGELKLETISYAQQPTLFVKVIQAYVNQGITQRTTHTNIEDRLREKAEQKIAQALKGKPLKKWWFKYITKKARNLVSNRENLRYERTRGFGMVRKMFSALGEKLYEAGLLAHPRDVFYLQLEEIKALENQAFNESLKTVIQERKTTFAAYHKQKPPEERFFTYGNEFKDEYIYSLEKTEGPEENLSGIGCCPGVVRGKVQVVTSPNEIDSLNGDILVTSSTDPGWITLFPTASAIIVERGSLLSHSAIVSREMGIPCIVSVTGLLRTLKSGDEVKMDGSTGKIKMIKHESAITESQA